MSASLEINRLIERQLRNWELARQQRLAEPAPRDPRRVEPFVAISREVGCDAPELVQRLGEKLGWPVFDKELLAAMAGDDQVRRKLYERMDERDASWLESVLKALIRGDFSRNDYFSRLSETVLALARQGSAVFLGRGCHHILPAGYGLCVRLVAPLEKRIAAWSRRFGLDAKAARAQVEKITHERDEYLRRHFLGEPTDPSAFDLVINVDRFSPDQTLELLLCTLRLRGLIRSA